MGAPEKPLRSTRDGAVEQLGCDPDVHDGPRLEQELSGPEWLSTPAGAGLEPNRAVTDQVRRDRETAGHARMHCTQPLSDPPCEGRNLPRGRVLVVELA